MNVLIIFADSALKVVQTRLKEIVLMEMLDLEGRHLPASHASKQPMMILLNFGNGQRSLVVVMVIVMATKGKLSSPVFHASGKTA